MFVLVCPPVCVIPVTAVAGIDYIELLPMKITFYWTFVRYTLSISKTILYYTIIDFLEVDIRIYLPEKVIIY